MFGYTLIEVKEIYDLVAEDLESSQRTNRGKKCTVYAKDAFFLACVTMKNGGTLNSMDRIFGMKDLKYEGMIVKARHSTSSVLSQKCMREKSLYFTMKQF